MKKTLIALLLALLILLSLGCTGKGEPKETKPASETAGQTETTAPETESEEAKKKERIGYLVGIMNSDAKSPEEVFSMLGGDYSLDNFSYVGVDESAKVTVNAFKNGDFFAGNGDSMKRFTLKRGGYYYVVDTADGAPVLSNLFTESDMGEGVTLLGSAGFSLASYFKPEEKSSAPDVAEAQIVLDGDRATFTEDYIAAVVKELDAEKVELSYDFGTDVLELIAEVGNESIGTIRVVQNLQYGKDGRVIGQTMTTGNETKVDDVTVSVSSRIVFSDIGYDDRGELISFSVSAEQTVTTTGVYEGSAFTQTDKQTENGTFAMKDGRPDVDLTMDVEQKVKVAGQEQTSSYTVKEQIKPGMEDKYLVKTETYVGDTLAASVSADCVFDARLFPEIPEDVKTYVDQTEESLRNSGMI